MASCETSSEGHVPPAMDSPAMDSPSVKDRNEYLQEVQDMQDVDGVDSNREISVCLSIDDVVVQYDYEIFCEYCGISCATDADHVAHLREHHAAMEDKDLPECPACHKTLNNASLLKQHRAVCSNTPGGKSIITRSGGIRREPNQDKNVTTPTHTFKCQFCDSRFTTRAALESHVDFGHEIMPPDKFSCHLCKKSFHKVDSLQRHLNTVHPLLEMDSQEETESNIAETHTTPDSATLYACPFCDKMKIPWFKILKLHIQNHHSDYTEEVLEVHIQIIPSHIKTENVVTNLSHNEINSETKPTDKQHLRQFHYICPKCEYITKQLRTLKSHMHAKKHMNDFNNDELNKLDFDLLRFEDENVEESSPLVTMSSKYLKCPCCWFVCQNKKYMNHHLRVQHNSTKVENAELIELQKVDRITGADNDCTKSMFFECPHCSLVVIDGIERHVATAHSSEYKKDGYKYDAVEMVVRYIADDGTYKYSEMDTEEAVVNAAHMSGSQPWKQGGTKIEGTQIVSSTGQVDCPYCPSVLSAISHLKRHVVRHHLDRIGTRNKTDVFVAEEVKQRRSHQRGVKRCIACPKAFTTNADLHRHLLSHKDVIVYLCDGCDLAFSRLIDLVKHVLEHPATEVAARRRDVAKCMDRKGQIRKQGKVTDIMKEESLPITVSSPSEVKCPYCPSVLGTLSHLKNHIVCLHMERLGTTKTVGRETCVMAIGQVMENSGIGQKQDENTVGNKLKKCIACPKIFRKNIDLHSHLLTHKDIIYFSCASCGTYFNNLFELVKHMYIHRETGTQTDGLDELAESEDTEEVVVVSEQGDAAGHLEPGEIRTRLMQVQEGNTVKHVRLSELQLKKRKISREDEEYDTKRRKVLTVKNESLIHDEKISNNFISNNSPIKDVNNIDYVNKCPYCEFTCRRGSAMKFHVKMHHPDKPVTADFAEIKQEAPPTVMPVITIVDDAESNKDKSDKSKVTTLIALNIQTEVPEQSVYTQISLLLKEQSDQDSTNQSHKCTICNITYKSLTSLIHHRRVAHVDKKYACDHCDKRFTFPAQLTFHEAIHGEKSISCTFAGCASRFSCQRYLRDHLRTVHKTHVPMKGKGFRHVSAKPWRQQKSHPCDMCRNRYRSLPALQFHVREVHNNEERPNKCDQCTKAYWRRGELRRHRINDHRPVMVSNGDLAVESVVNKVSFFCEGCGNRFSNRKAFMRHKKRVHGLGLKRKKSAMHHCEQCGMIYNSATILKLHVLQNHSDMERPHKCDQCSKAYWHRGELTDHISSFHLKQRPFMCEECGKGFTAPKGLRLHIERHKRDQMRSEAPPADDEAVATIPQIFCHICGDGMPIHNGRQALHSHLLKVHSETITCGCEICATVYNENEPAVGKVKAMCPECKQCFCQKQYLEGHMQAMHPHFGNHECKFCPLKFASQKLLTTHMHRDHKPTTISQENGAPSEGDLSLLDNTATVEQLDIDASTPVIQIGLDNMPRYLPKLSESSLSAVIKELRVQNDDPATSANLPFKCLLCARCFRKAKYVNVHIRSFHVKNEDQPYRCKVCGNGFESLPRFRKHARTHSNFRPFKCGVCQKAFKQSEHLKEHELIHVYGATVKCRLCQRMFKQRGAMTGHLLSHDKLKPFKCQFCERGFSDRGQLSRHMKQYLTIKEKGTHMCHICSETFSHFPMLMTHINTHNTTKPFQCSACQEHFSSFVQMYFHKDKHNHFIAEDLAGIDQYPEESPTTNEVHVLKYHEGESIIVEPLADGMADLIVDQSHSGDYSMVQEHADLLNSGEVVIETVDFDNEGTVYSVPEGRTSDEILSIAKQLTELSGYTMSPVKNGAQTFDAVKIEPNPQEQEIILQILDVDDEKRLEKLKIVTQEIPETSDTQETELATEIIVHEEENLPNNDAANITTDEVGTTADYVEVDQEVETTETTLYDETQYGEHVTIVVSSYGEEEQVTGETVEGMVVRAFDGTEYLIPSNDADVVEAVRALNAGQATIHTGEQYMLEELATSIEQAPAVEEVLLGPEPSASGLAIMNTTTYVEEFPPRKPLLADVESWTHEAKRQRPVIDMEFTESADGGVTCPICGNKLKGRKQLKEHVLRHQGSIQKIFACEHPGCGKQFYNGAELRRHAYIHLPYEQRPHQCDICGKRFLQAGHLRSHELLHTGEKPFACPHADCESSFITRTQVKTHFISVHVDEKHICCSLCDESFKDKAAFTRHIGNKHSAFFDISSGATPDTPSSTPKRSKSSYICEVCGEELQSKTSLEHHINIHIDSRPYVCEMCAASFRTLQKLNGHIASCHKSEDKTKRAKRKPTTAGAASSKKFSCPGCSRAFAARHSLAYHLGANENCRLAVPTAPADTPVQTEEAVP